MSSSAAPAQQPVKNATNDQTGNGYASLQIVTTQCHAVLNTVFIAPPKKPDWFDDLSTKLDAAKALANEWIDNLAPQLTASVPGHVIDYATTYTALSAEITALALANPNAQGKDDPTVQEILALVQALHDAVETIIKQVDTTAAQVTAWGDKMQTAHDDLYKGAANIQNLETTLKADIDKMNNAIQALHDEISMQQKVIAGMGAAIGLGCLAVVGGLALAPFTLGGSLVVAGAGALLIIGGAVTWGVMQHKINDEFDDISKDQQEKDDDQRQIVALQGLSLAANSAVTAIATATSSLSDVKTLWQSFRGDLQGTVDKLNSAEQSVNAIVEMAFTKAAQDEWNIALAFAQGLTTQKLTVETKQVSMVSEAA